MRYTDGWFRIGGLTVAVIGFGITRLVIAESLHANSGVAYLFSGLVPLLVGLGVTVYGISLAVGPYSESYSLLIAKWCVIGTITMLVVVGVSSLESILMGGGLRAVIGGSSLLANTLLAGLVGGVAIGHKTATNRAQRDANKRQANRAIFLDRLLRHEVINAITIIRLNAQNTSTADAAAVRDTITSAADRISETIDKVAELIEEKPPASRLDLSRVVADEIDDLQSTYPAIRIDYQGPPNGLEAAVDHRIGRVVRELVAFASSELDTTRIQMRLESADYHLRLVMDKNGANIRDDLRRLLTGGEFPEYDDPSSGFSLPTIRLLVREYGGTISVGDATGTENERISIALPKSGGSPIQKSITISNSQAIVAAVAGLLAGGVMGGYLVTTTELVPIIGALYGANDPVIGWTTHLFHSVVFAIIFAAVVSHPRIRRLSSNPLYGLVAGIAWGIVLWLFAAGVVMPLWLNLVGISENLPNLPSIGLVSHTIWGAIIGGTYTVLNGYVLTGSECDLGVERLHYQG